MGGFVGGDGGEGGEACYAAWIGGRKGVRMGKVRRRNWVPGGERRTYQCRRGWLLVEGYVMETWVAASRWEMVVPW